MVVTFYSPSAPTQVVVEPATLAGGWTSWVEVVVPAPGEPRAYLHPEIAEALVGLLGLDLWAAEGGDLLVGLLPAREVPGVLARAGAALADAGTWTPWTREERVVREPVRVVVEPDGLRRVLPGRVMAVEWAVTNEQLVVALETVRAVLVVAVERGWAVAWG